MFPVRFRLAPAALRSLGLAAAFSGALAAAQAAQGWPTDWTGQRLSTATYVILDPQMQGNPDLLGGAQRQGILDAMRRDSARALKRRYPGATIAVAGTTAHDSIRVTPVLITPGALLPWLKLTAQLEFALPGGQRVVLGEQFGLLVLWQKQADAANYLYDQLARKLP
ncbi:hypothetical protein [Deinococcus aerophilus]|nr:hypothetical protein [Deinococcus aerophilus]